jgi:hypothetical protein
MQVVEVSGKPFALTSGRTKHVETDRDAHRGREFDSPYVHFRFDPPAEFARASGLWGASP